MKPVKLIAVAVVLCLSSFAFGQSDVPSAPKSESQRSFEAIKGLAGNWEGHVSMDPPMQGHASADIRVSMRVTSRGNAIVHEMQESNTPLDATKYDHPVTMLYLDNGQLTLVHYCDAGNRPRMTGKTSADGKKVEFEFVDLSGSNQFGHMYHAVFTTVDANHHVEEWTYMMPGDKPMHARMELQRVQ